MSRATMWQDLSQFFCVGAFMAFTVAAALFPIAVMRQNRKRSRDADQRVPRCLGCGYDLRGSGHVCPECGQPHTHAQPTPDEVARQLADMTKPPSGGPDQST